MGFNSGFKGLIPSHDPFLLDALSIPLFLFNVCYHKPVLYPKALTTRDLGDTQYKIRQPARTVHSYDRHNS